jgi:tetratricopeptide (TPR) repeat protein
MRLPSCSWLPAAAFWLSFYPVGVFGLPAPALAEVPESTENEQSGAPEQPPDEPPGEPSEPAPPEPSDAPAENAPADDGPAAEAEAGPGLKPAALEGVQPGETTRDELHEKWGKPNKTERIAGGARETFHVEGLGAARVTILEDMVAGLSVQVKNPLPLASVVERLAIEDVEPVDVRNEQGELLGAAFPPRGVLLGFVPRSRPPQVFQIIVEPPDAEAFLARAEARLATRYGDALADVRQALELAPENARAQRLRAQIALASGDLEGALAAAQKAVEVAPRELEYRLLLAQVLAASGDYPQALARVQDVLDEPKVPEVVAARAHLQWGDYLAVSAHRDFAEAIQHHQQAIKLAEPLAAHPQHVVRRAAKEVLVDAHLAVAYDIGHGRWQQKASTAAKWIDRAAAFAEDVVANEHAGREVYLRVYAGALAALAGIAEPPEAEPWIRGIVQDGKHMLEGSTDPAYRARLAWELALALAHAAEIQSARHKADEALALAEMALAHFDESSPVSGRLPTYNYERGRLCYRIGAVHAVERSDHASAVSWFDRAAPLLEKPVPAAAIDPGTLGETFVSMAVSYWERENRREALRLTSQGVKLMEQAVSGGTLNSKSLAIPCANLASMHEALGEYDEAKKYAELAAGYEADSKKK